MFAAWRWQRRNIGSVKGLCADLLPCLDRYFGSHLVQLNIMVNEVFDHSTLETELVLSVAKELIVTVEKKCRIKLVVAVTRV